MNLEKQLLIPHGLGAGNLFYSWVPNFTENQEKNHQKLSPPSGSGLKEAKASGGYRLGLWVGAPEQNTPRFLQPSVMKRCARKGLKRDRLLSFTLKMSCNPGLLRHYFSGVFWFF